MWRRIKDGLYYASGIGSVYRKQGKWYGTNTSYEDVFWRNIPPTVGPFKTMEEAIAAYENARIDARGVGRRDTQEQVAAADSKDADKAAHVSMMDEIFGMSSKSQKEEGK